MTRFARLFFKIYSSPFIWRHCLNREAKRLQQQSPLQLDNVGEKIVCDLKLDGIAVSRLDQLFPDNNPLSLFREYTDTRRVLAETKTAKTFLRQLWDATPSFKADDPFIRLAMEEKILAIVNAYLAMYAKLYYFTLNVTTPMENGEAPVQSQKWHRDPEDRNMCKIFLYLNDVDDSAGPFVYIKGSQYGGKYGHLFPQNPPRGSYPPESEVLQAVPKDAIFTATGKAGTIIFCDTAGLHKGGYATMWERIMFTGGYRTSSSPWPVRYKFTEDAKREVEKMSLSRPVRYALNCIPPKIPLYFLKKIKKNFEYN